MNAPPHAALSAPEAAPGRAPPRPPGPSDVAVLLPHLRTGGAELSMLRLARGFVAKGLCVDLVSARDAGELAASWRDGLHRLGPAQGATRGVLLELVRYLRRARPGVLICGQPHLNLAALLAVRLARGGTRTLLIEHAPLTDQIRFEAGWRYRALPYVIPRAYRAADRVVAVSRGVRAQLRAMLGDKPVALIANPVLPPDLLERVAAPAGHAWLDAAGSSEHAPRVVLGIGRLAPEKDFAALIRAFARLGASMPRLRLVILGEGPERPRLEALARELDVADRVAMPGRVANVFAYLARAAAFALTSRYEGFGNVLVEALAAGTPVVSTDCPTGPAEILEGGRLGRLVPVGDAEALTRALAEALTGARAPSPDVAPYLRRFTIDASVDAYLDLIAPFTAGRSAPPRKAMP